MCRLLGAFLLPFWLLPVVLNDAASVCLATFLDICVSLTDRLTGAPSHLGCLEAVYVVVMPHWLSRPDSYNRRSQVLRRSFLRYFLWNLVRGYVE